MTTDALSNIGRIASSGLQAQRQRLQVISENLANTASTGSTPGADPYQRKTITFEEMVENGASLVKVKDIGRDTRDFSLEYDPSHPAANEDGFVKTPNVNALAELADMREAANSHKAVLNMIQTGRSMKAQLIDMLKS